MSTPTEPDPPAPRLYRPGDRVRMARGVRKGLALTVCEVLHRLPADPAGEPILVRVRQAETEDGPRVWLMPKSIERAS